MSLRRESKWPPSDLSKGFSRQRSVPAPLPIQGLTVIESPTNNTTFFALSKRISPIAHLKALRGAQDELKLHTTEYMSPWLHNSSDTYHRHLRAQVLYNNELSQGLHQKRWVKKQKERWAFNAFASHLVVLGRKCNPFLDGIRTQVKEDDAKRLSYENKKEELLKRAWDSE